MFIKKYGMVGTYSDKQTEAGYCCCSAFRNEGNEVFVLGWVFFL